MSRTVVVTGANRGIGLEFVKHYLAAGDAVFALCRQTSTELSATGATIIEQVDVSQGDVEGVVKTALAGVSVDILVNNAGILRDESLGALNWQTIGDQFRVNTLGPLRITQALLSNLHSGSKVALITSRMGSIADNGSGGRYGYRMSKAALNAAGMSLARDLKPKGIAVAILHPGYVQTEMVGGSGDIPPQLAAERLAARIEGLSLDNTGTFWHSNGEVLPW